GAQDDRVLPHSRHPAGAAQAGGGIGPDGAPDALALLAAILRDARPSASLLRMRPVVVGRPPCDTLCPHPEERPVATRLEGWPHDDKATLGMRAVKVSL